MSAETVIVIGVGQLGSLLSAMFEKRGARVVRVRRGEPLDAGLAPELVVITVGEDDLDGVLAALPVAWRDRVVLVQNELAPDVWRSRGIDRPTIAIVWFEKKGDRAARVVMPTLIAGPSAERLAHMLTEEQLAACSIADTALPRALLDKNAYILTSNIAGLAAPPGTTTDALLELPLLRQTCRVFADVLRVESARLSITVDADDASAAMMRAFHADPNHVAAGRSAPARLRRTLARADALQIDVPTLREIAAMHR